MAFMSDRLNTAVLDELFNPVTECFTPEVARRINAIRASAARRQRARRKPTSLQFPSAPGR